MEDTSYCLVESETHRRRHPINLDSCPTNRRLFRRMEMLLCASVVLPLTTMYDALPHDSIGDVAVEFKPYIVTRGLTVNVPKHKCETLGYEMMWKKGTSTQVHSRNVRRRRIPSLSH